MTSPALSQPRKRLLVSALAGVFLMEALVPLAHATVSQQPALYSAPPDVNIMFTLDDSGSMMADAIPDFARSGITDMPTNGNSGYNGRGSQFPNMWGNNSQYYTEPYYRMSNAIARYMRSAAGNPLYYNPANTYLPWPSAANDQVLSPAATPGAVVVDVDSPFSTSPDRIINLNSNAPGFWPATFFVYRGATPMPLSNPTTPLNIEANFVRYEIRPDVLSYPRAATRTDCTGAVGATGCTYAQERQNFANWLQYYRNRRLMAKGGVATAFAKQGTNLRVGFATINSNVTLTGSSTAGVVRRGVAPFSGTNRSTFFTTLYAHSSGERGVQTPLRYAMDSVGQYFSRSGARSPWAEDPTSASAGTQYSCRRSFHILSTDGYWNDAAASTNAARQNNDTFSGSAPANPNGPTGTFSNGTNNLGIDPFRDDYSDTLSDVAAYYWRTDLSGLANNVAPSTRDPAYWQHLSTFTVGLGISGSGEVTASIGGSPTSNVVPSNATTNAATSPLRPHRGKQLLADQGVRDALIATRTRINWTQPGNENIYTGDDLIHASMVGRGRYFSATNPTDLANGLTTALSEAVDQPIGLSSAAADSPQVSANSRLYQATFSPSGWYGRLYAFAQNALTGAVDTTPGNAIWEASNMMPEFGNRTVFTMNVTATSQTGSTFAFSGLNATQRANICVPVAPATSCTGAVATEIDPIVNYLKGSSTDEVASGGAFRDRSRYQVGTRTGGVLGDIVNGSPIKGPDAGGGYERMASGTPGQSTYATFRSGTGLDAMRNTLFVGANDGMLHAFAMDTGIERFAYVPNAVFNVPNALGIGTGAEQRLRMLSSPTYTHRFTVDGPPNISDAYFGSSWKSVLVAGHGVGARSVYAMDVTNPVVGGSNGFGTNKLLWEFPNPLSPVAADVDNVADMGYVTGYPHVARMKNGQWAAIFGNGYDSSSGRPTLFIVNIQTGALIRKLSPTSATVGLVEAGGPRNGLSSPNFVLNNNREVETIYAGDLSGAMWKFDVSATNEASWNVAFSNQPLFRARTATNLAQPITAMPEIAVHPDGGAMLFFGTGKLFETEDTQNVTANMNLRTQTIYGIWDRPAQTTGITTGRVALQMQSAPTGTNRFEASSPTAVTYPLQRGWYMDLPNSGERVNVNATKVRDVLFVIANTPVVDPCSTGGTARVFALDPINGARPAFPVYDIDGNSVLNSQDEGYNVLRITTGVLTQPIFQRSASSTNNTTVGVSTAPTRPFDVGQASGSRQGGVELDRTASDLTQRTAADCAALMAAARSDTGLLSQLVGICSPTTGRARITWRQVR